MPGSLRRRIRDRRSGFTLVELLVVIAVVGMLLTMLLPALNNAREAAKRMRCAANLKQLGVVTAVYSNDYKGFLPYGPANAAGWSSNYLYIGPSATVWGYTPGYSGMGLMLKGLGGGDGTGAGQYLSDPKAFICPAVDRNTQDGSQVNPATITNSFEAGTYNVTISSYAMNWNVHGKRADDNNSAFWLSDADHTWPGTGCIVQHDSVNNGVNRVPDGMNILGVNGAVIWVTNKNYVQNLYPSLATPANVYVGNNDQSSKIWTFSFTNLPG